MHYRANLLKEYGIIMYLILNFEKKKSGDDCERIVSP